MTSCTAGPVVPWSLLVVASVGLGGTLAFGLGIDLRWWLLPTCMLAMAAVARPRWPRLDGWLPNLAALLGVLAIGYGALATPDRSWDGFATWSLTARHLAAGATVDHPYFTDATVYHAARGYPLLQPLLLAQLTHWLGDHGGRVLFPLLWWWLLLSLREALRAVDVEARPRRLATLGLAAVPLFVEPGHGSAESGFADLLLATLLLHAGSAVLRGRLLAALVVGLALPLAKQEGAWHAALWIAAAIGTGRGRPAMGLALGASLAALSWAPVRARLLLQPEAAATQTLLAVALPWVALLGAAALRPPRRRWWLVAALLATAGLAVGQPTWLPAAIQASLADHAIAPAALLPIAGALLQHLVWLRKFGLSFVVLLAALAALRRHGSAATSALLRPLHCWWLGWLLTITLYLASRGDLLELFLREGLARYLAQSVGVVWLGIGLALAQLGAGPAASHDPAPGTPRGQATDATGPGDPPAPPGRSRGTAPASY
jgi:hypothetical protein